MTVLYEGKENTDNPFNLAVPLRGYDEDLRLRFTLHSEDPYFLVGTDLPLQSRPFYYLSNRDDNRSPSGERRLFGRGNSIDHVSAVDQVEWVHENRKIRWEVTAVDPVVNPITRTEITVKDQSGSVKLNRILELKATDLGPGETRHPVALEVPFALWGGGLFSVRIDDRPERFLFASSELTGERPLAVIELYAKEHAATEYAFLNDDNKPVPRDYYINFKTRSSIWRYYFVNLDRDNIELSKIQVVDSRSNGDVISFKAADRRKLPALGNVIYVESEAPVPFTFKPVKSLTLKDTNGQSDGTNELVIEPLPNPARSQLSWNEEDAEPRAFYSDIYVYV